jgi:hypothetical protein
MTPLQLQLCAIQGRLFELSAKGALSSDVFIPAYMTSKTCERYDAPYHRLQWCGEEYLMEELLDEYKTHKGIFSKSRGQTGKTDLFSQDELYWIGYMYRYWHFLTGEKSKQIYRQAPIKIMKKTYPGFHTIDEKIAIENIKSLGKGKTPEPGIISILEPRGVVLT